MLSSMETMIQENFFQGNHYAKKKGNLAQWNQIEKLKFLKFFLKNKGTQPSVMIIIENVFEKHYEILINNCFLSYCKKKKD
jgi:hypothetical protein